MKKHYIMKCSSCGAATADSVRVCPYCDHPTDFLDLVNGEGIERSERGGLLVRPGNELVVGYDRDEGTRACPFCGATVEVATMYCPYCEAKIVIERLRVATLDIEDGGLVSISSDSGPRVVIVGRRTLPIHEAAQEDNAEKVKRCVLDGDDPNHPDKRGDRPLHYAAKKNALEAAKALIAHGACADIGNDAGVTPGEKAAECGHLEFVAFIRRMR